MQVTYINIYLIRLITYVTLAIYKIYVAAAKAGPHRVDFVAGEKTHNYAFTNFFD